MRPLSFSVIFIAACTLSPNAHATAATATPPILDALADVAALVRFPQVNKTEPGGSRIWLSRVSDLVRDRMQIMKDFKARHRCKLTEKIIGPLNNEFVKKGLPKMSPLALKHYEATLRHTSYSQQCSAEEIDCRDNAIRRIISENPNVSRKQLNNLVTEEIRRLQLPAVTPCYRSRLIKRARVPPTRAGVYYRRFTGEQIAIRQAVIMKAVQENPDLPGTALVPLVADEMAKLDLPTMLPVYIVQLIYRLRASHQHPPASSPISTTVAPFDVDTSLLGQADISVGSDGAMDEESACPLASDDTSDDSEIILVD